MKSIPNLDSDHLSRFWSKVDKTNDCWLWTAAKVGGYGVFHINRKPFYAHRISWSIQGRTLVNGMVTDHLCGVRFCVNPKHLEQVTQKINVNRGKLPKSIAGRTHCPQGHEYAGNNLYIYKTKDNKSYRRCRECHRVEARRYYNKRDKI